LQVDLNLPQRFDIGYIDEQGERRQPVMLHRALFGSLERFIGILIEHYSGALPYWLAPHQAVVLNISESQSAYAQQVTHALRQRGLRVQADLRNEKISYKIREHSLQKVPYLLVLGDKEKDGGFVSLRSRHGEDLGRLPLEQAVQRMAAASR
jgi:threonyl-tRNA synthetase